MTYIFSINDGYNCIKVGSSYGLIRNICKGPCDESEPVVFLERFVEHSDLFTQPLNSSDLGILKVPKLCGNIESVLLSQIECKFVKIPYKEYFVIIPLLHQFI